MDRRQIQQVRRFSRLVTQRVGALEDSYLSRGRPLGEARLIFEAGADGVEVRALRDTLGLDSGYLSRLLRSLTAQGLVEVRKQTGDGRLRRVVLTEKGRAELAAYERLSDELAQSMLALLEAPERDRLVAAMAEVERLIRAGAVEARLERPDTADARWCLGEYFRELTQRFETGFDPATAHPVRDEDMTPPAGFFFVARLDGRPVGCGALLRVDDATGEVKRMWTAAAARRVGVARRIIATIEATARGAGLTTLRLDTNRALKEAQALYRKLGFEEVAPFNANPYAHHWFRKRLQASSADGVGPPARPAPRRAPNSG
jgi:DNA-binding MarR family transcriptional regulator/GNAT superfamily N-acetyltransferase